MNDERNIPQQIIDKEEEEKFVKKANPDP